MSLSEDVKDGKYKIKKRPLLNYFGGKWMLAPWIIESMPEHKIYIEPFGGSLSVLLRKPRAKREIVNDIDSELVNLYLAARDHGENLKRLLELTPHSRDEYKKSMIKTDEPIEQARRTIVRCYFGIGDSFLHKHNAFRNSKTSNTCVAKSWKSYHEAFLGIKERLSGVTIENLSYEKLFEKYDSKDALWYLDPPYAPTTRSKKHSYREDWTNFHYVKFIGEIQKLKGSVILSGYDFDLMSELSHWEIKKKQSKTQSGFKEETLWIKK